MLHRFTLQQKKVTVSLVGAGGNGSHMAFGLAKLHLALVALGHPGLRVAIVDPDTVSTSNVIRQLFMPQEVGRNKAICLAQRLNLLYALDFHAYPVTAASAHHVLRSTDLIIGAVDNAKARASIKRAYQRGPSYWLDLGNRSSDGQFILGHRYRSGNFLPSVADLYPEICRPSPDDDDTPSCSIAESLSRQELFINPSLTQAALNLLWRLLRPAIISA